jgi:hypothetical protein
MAEPMHAFAPGSARRPAVRKPRLPHPHLAPLLADGEATLQAPAPHAESWTPAALPMARPAGRQRRGSRRPTAAERLLRTSLRFGLFANGAALLIPRLFPTAAAWRYDGGDFVLAAAVLLSGHILLRLGRGD